MGAGPGLLSDLKLDLPALSQLKFSVGFELIDLFPAVRLIPLSSHRILGHWSDLRSMMAGSFPPRHPASRNSRTSRGVPCKLWPSAWKIVFP
jgi:hypothetical protein